MKLVILSPQPGWAEQDPEGLWQQVCTAIHRLFNHTGARAEETLAIGIACQMHGLAAVNLSLKVLRPYIIWCEYREENRQQNLPGDRPGFLPAAYALLARQFYRRKRQTTDGYPPVAC